MNQIDVEFEKVVATDKQISTLFDLLKNRGHKISAAPSTFLEHTKFVKNHPYVSWYIVKSGGKYVGSFYISYENTIGINIIGETVQTVIGKIIEFVQANYTPLPPIHSVRNGKFAINVPPSNTILSEALEEEGCKLAQITYFVPE